MQTSRCVWFLYRKKREKQLRLFALVSKPRLQHLPASNYAANFKFEKLAGFVNSKV
jgi:hypothetical protein